MPNSKSFHGARVCQNQNKRCAFHQRGGRFYGNGKNGSAAGPNAGFECFRPNQEGYVMRTLMLVVIVASVCILTVPGMHVCVWAQDTPKASTNTAMDTRPAATGEQATVPGRALYDRFVGTWD